MKKHHMIALAVLALALVAGCTPVAPGRQGQPLFNQTLNEELENSTIPQANSSLMPVNDTFEEFTINFTRNPAAKYDFASDDVLAVAGEDFDSRDAAVLGIMIGDTYEDVIGMLGTPDLMYVPADKSYRNMEYGKKIGIGGSSTAVTYRLEGDKVVRISMRQPFDKYLVGNTSIGQRSDYIYSVLDTPDYQSFLTANKVLHYVENGLELYVNRDKLEIISILPPQKFVGVEYRTVPVEVGKGIYANSTKPFPLEPNGSDWCLPRAGEACPQR